MTWSHDVPPYLAEYAPVIDRFGAGYYRGGYCYRCCAAHQDDTPSLSFWLGRGKQLMFGCFANCRKQDILKAAGLTWRDCFPPREEQPKVKVVATYDYTDEAGKLLYQVVRYQPKDFRQRRPVPGGWAWNLDGVRRVLYRLPDLIASGAEGRAVILCEGEKDVETARRLGLVGTTAAGGARAPWLDEYGECLSGRHVALVPDQDAAGAARACNVAGALMFWGALSIRLVSLPAKDLTAYVEGLQGEGIRSRDELRRRVEEQVRLAQLWRPVCPKAGGVS